MRTKLTIFLLLAFYCGFSQIGGKSTYQFINVVSSPKVAALGGYAIAVPDADLEMAYFNPALLDSNLSNHLTLNYVDYFTDINYGFVGYAKTFDKIGTFSLNIKYINYGDFIQADENGNRNGEFSVSESVFVLGYGNRYKYGLSYGANLKVVYSNFYQYSSLGALLDFGGTWYKKESEFMMALTVKNLGSQIKPYVDGQYEPMPFEVQLGVSKRLKHAPFRFSLVAHNLQTPNFYFASPNDVQTTNLFGLEDSQADESNLAETIFRHVTGGVELILSDNFQLRMGYNHQRRSELMLREGSKKGMVGFSFGAGIKIKKFRIDYGRSIYHLAGATNHLSISTNLSDFKRRKADDVSVE